MGSLKLLAMQISINGEYIDGFTYASVSQDFTAACRDFIFISSSKGTQSYPVKRGDKCQIISNDQTILDGFIDTISGNYSSQTDTITVTGRSKTMDLIDSTINYTLFSEWKGGISLIDACEEILKQLGLENDIEVIPETSDVLAASELKTPIDQYFSAQNGESAFAFLEKYAQSLKVILSTDNRGNLLITRGTNENIIPFTIINKINDAESTNNVVKCRWISSEKNLFNKYICWSQLAQAPIDFRKFEGGGGESQAVKSGLYGVSGEFDYTRIRPSRQHSFNALVPLSIQSCTSRARWQANYNLALSQVYMPTLQGHTFDGKRLWDVNKLIQVYDERADINTQLLIKKVNFTQSLNGGNITELTCVPKDSFTLKVVTDYFEERYSDTQANYDILRDFS